MSVSSPLQPAAHKRLRVAWFSPLTSAQMGGAPETSMAAYATSVLLSYVERECDVDLFHDRLDTYEGRQVRPHLCAMDIHCKDPYDIFFYHIEDGKHSYFSRIHAGIMPGVVWFHDLFLTDFGPEPILNSAWRETVGKFHDDTRQWISHDAKHEPRGPHAFREAALAVVRIFSSERDHGEFQRLDSKGVSSRQLRSYYLPLPIEPSCVPAVVPARGEDMNRAPATNGPLHILYCGTPRIESRAHVLLNALSVEGLDYRLHWLVAPEEIVEAQELLEEFSIESVDLIPGRSPRSWTDLVRRFAPERRCVAIHTLFSVFGQLAPYVNASLMTGLPTVVCNFGQGELLPSTLVFKISCGESAVKELREVFALLVAPDFDRPSFVEPGSEDVPSLRSRVSSYGREMYSSGVVAFELIAVLRAVMPELQLFMQEWGRFEIGARSQLVRESHALLATDMVGIEPLRDAFLELGWR